MKIGSNELLVAAIFFIIVGLVYNLITAENDVINEEIEKKVEERHIKY